MNPDLARLQPYPFQKLAKLFEGVVPPAGLAPVNLSIGEPKHATPPFIKDALAANLGGLAGYPATLGGAPLRESIADWIARRFGIPRPDPATQVLPVNGSREALFAFAQTVVDRTKAGARVLMPNPFYQIYEGAALLAGATPGLLAQTPETGFACGFDTVDEATWRDTQLIFVCSPGNPTGRVMTLDDLKNHPIPRMLELGLKATINSDDPAYFGGYVGKNYVELARATGLGEAALAKLARNSFEGAFLSEAEKAAYLAEIDGYVVQG